MLLASYQQQTNINKKRYDAGKRAEEKKGSRRGDREFKICKQTQQVAVVGAACLRVRAGCRETGPLIYRARASFCRVFLDFFWGMARDKALPRPQSTSAGRLLCRPPYLGDRLRDPGDPRGANCRPRKGADPMDTSATPPALRSTARSAGSLSRFLFFFFLFFVFCV